MQQQPQFDFAEQIVMSQPAPEMAIGVFILFFLIWMFVVIAITVATVIIPLWLICKKAGISPYLSLLMLVPGVNLAFYWILALIDWPNLKKDATKSMIQRDPPTD
jgi:hypothetical protein